MSYQEPSSPYKNSSETDTELASISVVVPVYNGATTIAELVARLEPVLNQCGDAFEVILVNDGSQDDSWRIIRELAAAHSFVRGVDLTRNYGQHNALLAGIRAAQHDVIVTMDDDLQHPPEEIPLLLGKLHEGYDVVYGTPLEEQHGLWRSIASVITKMAMQSTLRTKMIKDISAFRALRSHLRDAFADYRGPFVNVDVLLTWGTTRFAATPVRHEARASGASSYTFRMLVVHTLNMMTGFSTLPLQAASLVGFVFTIFGLIVLAFVIVSYAIHGGSIPGFPFLASIIATFSGAQLFALGVIGEYLARMYFRSMGQPHSVVRNAIGFSPSRQRD